MNLAIGEFGADKQLFVPSATEPIVRSHPLFEDTSGHCDGERRGIGQNRTLNRRMVTGLVGFYSQPRPPKIAVPTRTSVAPHSMAIS